jgi:biopolymer transport protein ExbD
MASERAKAMRAARRTAAFAKFRMVELNLVPLVDTFVSIVFFALTAATVGELAPILSGVTLPEASVGIPAHQEVTLGVASNPAQIVFNGTPLMTVQEAASATSNLPTEPLVIPALYTRLKASVDSIRQTSNLDQNTSVDTKLAIQGDKTMRYDLLQRLLQTARMAGFKNITLQVHRVGIPEGGAAPTT